MCACLTLEVDPEINTTEQTPVLGNLSGLKYQNLRAQQELNYEYSTDWLRGAYKWFWGYGLREWTKCAFHWADEILIRSNWWNVLQRDISVL